MESLYYNVENPFSRPERRLILELVENRCEVWISLKELKAQIGFRFRTVSDGTSCRPNFHCDPMKARCDRALVSSVGQHHGTQGVVIDFSFLGRVYARLPCQFFFASRDDSLAFKTSSLPARR